MELKATWFGFELNHLQSILLLALAFIGLLNIPFGLLVGIKELLDAFFFSIPAHLAHPSWYTIYYVFDDFKSSIITIVMYLSFFALCLYTIRKIIRNDPRSRFKDVSSQEQITSWFGFKLNHSQSIMLFLFALIGIISISASFLRGLETYPYSIFFNDLFPNYNRYIQRALFGWLHLTIFAISLYTIIAMKMKYKRSQVELKMYHSTFLVISFLVSLIIVIFMVFKLLTLSYLPMNSIDFLATLLVLLFSSNLASYSFLRKTRKPHYKQTSNSSTEPIKDTKKNAKSSKLDLIMLLFFIFIFVIIYFSFITKHLGSYVYVDNYFLTVLLGPDSYIISYFTSLLSLFLQFLIATIPFFVIFYYYIGKKLTERELDELNIDIDKKWMTFHIENKSHAIILFWVSLIQLIFLSVYIFGLVPYLTYLYNGYYFFQALLLVILIGGIFAYCCYNLITLHDVQKIRRRPKSIISVKH